jgi:hypothetical protein
LLNRPDFAAKARSANVLLRPMLIFFSARPNFSKPNQVRPNKTKKNQEKPNKKSLDFLGFPRANQDFSTGYADFKRKLSLV